MRVVGRAAGRRSAACGLGARPSAATPPRRARCAPSSHACRRRRARTAAATDSTGKSNDAAAPQLPVRAAPAGLGAARAIDGQDLVGPLRQVVDAVVRGRGRATSTRALAAPPRRAARARRAPCSTGAVSVDDTAKQRGLDGATQQRVAVLLHAEVDRLPPLVVLVVVGAARVEAEVAADRAHVAQLRRRDLRGGLPQRRVAARAARASSHERRSASRRRRCATAPFASHARRSSRTPRRPISTRGVCCRRFMFGQQVGAAGDEHRLGRRARRASRAASASVARRAVREARQPHHRLHRRARRRRRRPSRSLARGFVAGACRRRLPTAAAPAAARARRSSGNAPGRSAPACPCAFACERLQDLLGRDRHLVDAHADRVEDRVGDRRHDRQQRSLARPPWRRTARSDRGPRSGR